MPPRRIAAVKARSAKPRENFSMPLISMSKRGELFQPTCSLLRVIHRDGDLLAGGGNAGILGSFLPCLRRLFPHVIVLCFAAIPAAVANHLDRNIGILFLLLRL